MATNTTTARESFEAGIEAAKRRAARTGENLADLLDRMDALDLRTMTARNPILSGDHAVLGMNRIRARLVVGPFPNRVQHEAEATRPAPLTA